MHLKITLSSLFTVLFVLGLNAQQFPNNPFPVNSHSHNGIKKCISDEIMHKLYNEDASFRKNVDSKLMTEMSNPQKSAMIFSDSIIRIPTVVHVIYNTSGSNISKSQIESQIDVLNEDFRKIPGTNGFGAGADTKIEFFLAQRDEQGNCTDGIVRINSSLSNHNSNTQEAQLKGLSQWNRNKYLNIWVVNSIDGGGVLGYAAFPGGPASLDGVVIADQFFGDEGTAGSGPFNLGRTATHEIGHWLGLFHTFQGGCSGSGDQVADTPPVDIPNFGCPIGHISCGSVDLIENYMDYSDDACFDMFTLGQSVRMETFLNQFRSNMLDSMNAINAGLNGCLIINYCQSSADTVIGTEIRNVTINSINNSSANDCQGYSNFKSKLTTLNVDSTFALSVSTGDCSSGTAQNHEVRAYFDWNANGDFTDSGEEFIVKANGPSGTSSINITVPSNAVRDITGMRIISTDGGVSGPCGIYPVGETEDYAIIIAESPSASISGGATICEGESEDLNFSMTGVGPFKVVYTNGTSNFTLNNINANHVETVSPSVGNNTYEIVSIEDQNFQLVAPNPGISGSANIIVDAAPIASYTKVSTTNNGIVNFTDQSIGATTWFWRFGDGKISSLQNPSHIYDIVGTYTAELTVTNAQGCNDKFSQSIQILVVSGLSELESTESLNVYPNPFESSFTFDLILDKAEALSVEITSLDGKLIHTLSSDTQTEHHLIIRDEKLKSGMYIIEVTLSDGRHLKSKIFKQ